MAYLLDEQNKKVLLIDFDGQANTTMLMCNENPNNISVTISIILNNINCTLTEQELVNEKITEVALIDEEDDVIAIRNFKAKYNDNDMQLRFFIEDEF